jgi:ribulose-phosphate 3-epimerase
MDGVFVPNISFGFSIINQVSKASCLPLDVHLMIVNPERYIEDFAKAGADYLTVHFEGNIHLHRIIEQIHSAGMKAGVAINPHTTVESISEIIPFADMILVMSVNPGFGGQKFISTSIDKVIRIREIAKKTNPNLLIEVDGGINESIGLDLYEAGADALVMGNAFFSHPKPYELIEGLR